MQQAHLGKSIKNDMWITEDEDERTPDVLPELPGFHVLVRPVSIKEKTKGGILLPNSTKDDMSYLTTIGEVIKIGDLAYNDNEKFPKGPWCQLGDYICYAKHAGQKIQYKNVKMILLYDDQVIMKVQDPKFLDPTFNLSKYSS
jgi:co-chaperonin GroES (HSP10)|tara:strand:- start:264 stop:692 length:429 start_codon:yes stop_codon:yes gene_type:complete